MICSPIAPLQCHFSPFTRCIVKKWKTKNTTLPEQFQNPIEEIVERGKIDTLNTHVHDLSLSGLGTGITIKSDGNKLVL